MISRSGTGNGAIASPRFFVGQARFSRQSLALCVFVATVATGATEARADSVVLHSGDRLTGTVQRMDTEALVLATSFAGVITIQRETVAEVTTDVERWLTLDSGERLLGRVVADSKAVRVDTALLGNLVLAPHTGLSIGGHALDDDDAGAIRARGDDPQAAAAPADSQAAEAAAQSIRENTRRLSRRSTLLTPRGAMDVSLGMRYAANRRATVDSSDLSLTATVQTGLTDRLDGALSVPLSHVTSDRADGRRRESGLGNISAGLRYLLRAESATGPEWVAGLSVSAPTGETAPVDDPTGIDLDAPYWSVNADLGLARSYDPVILYALFGYQYTHEYDEGDGTIDPGDAVYMGAGLGFAVNRQLSLSGQLLWAHRFDDERISGTGTVRDSREPASLRLGASLVLDKDSAVSGNVGFGLNDEATDASVNVTYTRRF